MAEVDTSTAKDQTVSLDADERSHEAGGDDGDQGVQDELSPQEREQNDEGDEALAKMVDNLANLAKSLASASLGAGDEPAQRAKHIAAPKPGSSLKDDDDDAQATAEAAEENDQSTDNEAAGEALEGIVENTTGFVESVASIGKEAPSDSDVKSESANANEQNDTAAPRSSMLSEAGKGGFGEAPTVSGGEEMELGAEAAETLGPMAACAA